MLDLFDSRKFIPPGFRDLDPRDQPRIIYRCARGDEVMRWNNRNQGIVREQRAALLEATNAQEAAFAGRTFALRAEGLTEGASVRFVVLEGDTVISVEEASAVRGLTEEQQAEDEARIDASACPECGHAPEPYDAVAVATWVPPLPPGADIELDHITHHIDLALSCVLRVDGVKAGGVPVDWKDDESLCKTFGVTDPDDARRRILLSLGKGYGAVSALQELCTSIATGLDEDQKKG